MTPTNKRPIVQVTAYVLARRADGKADAVKHTYDMNINGNTELLKSTLCHTLSQRFPSAKTFEFVTEEEYNKAIEEHTAEESPTVHVKTTLFDVL